MLSALDVVVVPSLCYENSPLVIHEAFAAGIPVIATDLGGMRELVQHEVNGLLFERANVQNLAHQLQRITQEAHLLTELRRGIPQVKSVDHEADELVSVYETIATRRQAKGKAV